MYERNAIVLERYFDKLFGYDDESNLKTNYKNYIDLVNSLEKYLEASESEDKIMIEYEEIADTIKTIQKEQSILYDRNIKLQAERNDLFSEVGENSEDISKRLEELEKEIEQTEEKIKQIGIKFIEQLRKFNEKIEIRTSYEKDNRIIETNYKKNLDKAIESFSKLNMEKIRNSKNFFEQENLEILEEIKAKILKNGEKEKVKFDLDVINKAIQVTIDINKREVECLNNIFDKIGKLFAEIKDDNIKIDKHNKAIQDTKVKLEFLNAEKEYIVLFLDNERLNIMNGQKEHRKLMEEACKYLELDLEQIQNLYELIQKEISGKSTKKAFKELYNMEYLYELDNKQKEFELKVSKLNLVGTIINPDYWRIEGVKKIYEVFRNIMVNVFEKDLSEYEYKTVEIVEEIKEQTQSADTTEKVKKKRGRPKKNVEVIEEPKEETIEKQEISDEQAEKNEEEIRKRKLDKILAFINNDSDSIEYDELELEEEVFDVENVSNEEDKIEYDDEIIEENEDIFEDEEDDFDFDDESEEDEDDIVFSDEDDTEDLEDEEDDFLDNEEESNEFDDDDFEDDEDFDFEDDDDILEEDFEEEGIEEIEEDKKKSKKTKKEDNKKKNKETGKNILNKIKKMTQSENEIKNMWSE